MCNVGQYPLFCGYWARQLAFKYINCGQGELYKNHLTENDECLQTGLHQHSNELELQLVVRPSGVWSLVWWQQCGDSVLPSLPLTAPLYSVAFNQNWEKLDCSRPPSLRHQQHCCHSRTVESGEDLARVCNGSFIGPVIRRKLMSSTGCAMTSDWSDYKLVVLCSTTTYLTTITSPDTITAKTIQHTPSTTLRNLAPGQTNYRHTSLSWSSSRSKIVSTSSHRSAFCQ